jgi:hypothetical protein
MLSHSEKKKWVGWGGPSINLKKEKGFTIKGKIDIRWSKNQSRVRNAF